MEKTTWFSIEGNMASINKINMNNINYDIETSADKVSYGNNSTVANELENLSIKYNPTDDFIYIKDANGNYVKWKQAGLKKFYIIENGKLMNDIVFARTVGSNSSFSEGDTYATFYIDGGGGMMQTTKVIDTSTYSKLCVEYVKSNANANMALGAGAYGSEPCCWLTSTTFSKAIVNIPEDSIKASIWGYTQTSNVYVYNMWLE